MPHRQPIAANNFGQHYIYEKSHRHYLPMHASYTFGFNEILDDSIYIFAISLRRRKTQFLALMLREAFYFLLYRDAP